LVGLFSALRVAFRSFSGVEACQFPCPKKDLCEHRAVEASGVGVAQRGVIGSEEMETVREQILGSVGKTIFRFANNDAGLEQVGEVAVEGDLSEGDYDTDAWQGLDLGGEVRGAVAEFLWERLVAGRGAADDGGDPGVAEFETVVAGDGQWSGGEAKLVEDWIHEVAGAVSGKGAAGAISSMGAGGEAEDEDAGAGIAEAGNGASPVSLILVSTAFCLGDTTAIGAET
jgi:hypothetical protein